MAFLTGRDFVNGVKRMELSPVPCLACGPIDAVEYILRIEDGEEKLVWGQTYSVAGWFTGHDDIWLLARTFIEVPKLLGTTIPVSLWRTDRPSEPKISADAHWLFVSFSLVSKQKNLRLVIFAQNNATEENALFHRFSIQVSVDEAHRFGLELEKEIIESSPIWAREREM